MNTIFQKAWDELWAGQLRARESEYHWKGSEGYYLTASDLADKVREMVSNRRWYSGKAGGKWLNAARDWLADEVSAGRLTRHNFGRGHISGMRYRPAGEPITETEKKTMEKKEARRNRPRPHHYHPRGYGCTPICVKKRKGGFYHRTTAWVTHKREDVTCPRCLKLLAEQHTETPAA